MLLQIGYELLWDVPSPAPAIVKLYLHPSQLPRLKQPECVTVEPEIPIEEFIDEFGNRAGRLILPTGRVRLWNHAIVEDNNRPEPVNPNARQHAVEDLPLRTVPYLLSSRYCEVDLLSEIAWQLFGQTPPGWARVQAVCDWVHENVRFGYEYARPTKTAYDVYTERTGVCRDFMHLAVTFCRCLHIPARCAAGYLGDIGVPPCPLPMDFSAWFEVYLDDRWYAFDARHNIPRVGRILMARGRDAVDIAFATSFGLLNLVKFTVWIDKVIEDIAIG
ncbi:transglutaminase [Chroococcidiopsis sp. CCALA 051]|uniref:transglutaminase-like domain-containing protein n=1 Tax=Chroococcidiopsis sp. CCALA 051 TaxID=869949 RepID=UPI000D0E0F7C|nr:transglutaminase family protein [Chroococcidiopsis sp. CCALA 051]PSM46089.1 transglutaminase [Chroococcidiopsis sp. CCALA 051]